MEEKTSAFPYVLSTLSILICSKYISRQLCSSTRSQHREASKTYFYVLHNVMIMLNLHCFLQPNPLRPASACLATHFCRITLNFNSSAYEPLKLWHFMLPLGENGIEDKMRIYSHSFNADESFYQIPLVLAYGNRFQTEKVPE